MSLIKAVKTHRVLVVDDLEHQRTEIIRALSKAIPNCKFAEAGSVAKAEAVLKEQVLPFDLAIIDIKLGLNDQGKDGNTLAEQISRKSPQTGIIVMSAYLAMEAESYDRGPRGERSFISKMEPGLNKKLRTKAKTLLKKDDIRESIRLQHKALEDANKVFLKKKNEWIRQYGGRFVLVIEGKVVNSKTDPRELQEALREYPAAQRCKASVIRVPLQ